MKATPAASVFACIILVLFMSPGAYSQQHDTAEISRVHFSGLPVVYYTPETKLAFGGLGIITFANPHYRQRYPSQVQLGVAYTTNQQLLFYVPFRIYLAKDLFTAYGELGYYKYSYFFYGIGNTQPVDYKELYKVNYPRVRVNGLIRVTPFVYAGIRYWYENFNIVQTEPGKELATDPTITGARGGITSGMGPVVNIDSRDNLFSPSHGWFGEAAVQRYDRSLGSDFEYSRYSADLSHYFAVTKKTVLAANIFFDAVSGNAPFNQLALLGGNKKMRGYYEGRYRDKDMLVTGVEYRFPIWWRFGAVVFANGGGVADHLSAVWRSFRTSGGAGLRYLLNKKDKVNIRLDAAFGQHSSGYYFTIGEAF